MDSSLFFTTVAAAIGFFTLLRKLNFHQNNKENNSSTLSPSSLPSSLSSPSPPSTLSHNWKNHVFPSFHGADVRKAFLSHILKEFRRKGVDPFIDNDIERSKSIGPELIEAIRGSRIAIVLLSKNYASSTWCMNELVEVMKCREEFGQTVMVIFYEVDPTDVKKQTGDFGRVFTNSCKGKTKKDIGRWRRALAEVAKIAGYHSSNWDDEASMIEKIATDISNKLNIATPSSDLNSLIGMGAHMGNMEPLLRLDLEEVRMVGIWGPPGIGKSTIARFLFNQLSNNLQYSAIMVNIKGSYPRPCLDEYSAQLQLQNQMLSQMINQKDIIIPHLGVAQERLKDKKVFLVLDDVDQLGQVVALAKEIRWFGRGSRIIITTEDLRVLKAHGINHIYKVAFPSTDEALQIFCTHAFGQTFPEDGFMKLAHEVTYLAGKLPLALKIMGSYFRGRSKQEWKMTLPKLRKRLDGEIESILKFSYDALSDEGKDLFLHIACFFKREQIKKVVQHLAESFMDVRHELHVLAEKSLIVFEYGRIWMHNVLVQLGKEIASKQSGQRQFLVDARDICEAFTISKSVIGIDFSYIKTRKELNIIERAFEGMSNLQFLKISSEFDPPHILSLLGHMNYISPKLRLLHWELWPMTCLPFIVNTEFLVELIMPHSKLEKLWEGVKLLQNLKWMDLSNSTNLKELPDLSTATSLEDLILSGCSSLVELTSSIGNATHLMELNLEGCTSLVKLPSTIGNATNLQILNLSCCSSLVELPSSIGDATNLQELYLSGCSSLVGLPFSIGNVINFQTLNLTNCSHLVELPSSIGNATNLKELNLSHCSSLVELPSSIGNATNLQILTLVYCSSLVELPSSIGNITNLKELDLSECSSLVKLPFSIGNATNLQKLHLIGCSSLVELPSSIGNADNLQDLILIGCSSLVGLPSSIGNATSLQKLHLSWCSSLVELHSSIGNATSLHELDLSYCSSLVSFPKLPDSLLQVDAENCESLERLGCSFSNPNIYLKFINCFKLNQEARDLIIKTPTSKYAVLPGEEVPAYFTYRAFGSSVTMKLNEKPLRTSTKFRACILLDYKGEIGVRDWRQVWVDCSVTSKHNTFTSCSSHRHFLKPILTEHLYTFEVEAEEVTFTELGFEFKLDSDTITNAWKIKECGILQL